MSSAESSNTASYGNVARSRPLSPHLQVYKPQITSVISILHRITGGILAVASIGLVLWLYALAFDVELFLSLSECLDSWFGQLVLIGLTLVFWFYVFCNVRYFAWSMGYGFELPKVYKTAYAVLIATAVATIITWLGM